MPDADFEHVATRTLRAWAMNPRRIPAKAVRAVMASIERFGFGSPIVVRRASREVIAGHARLKAARKLGLSTVPVRWLDLSESEAHALALVDNKTGELAAWEDTALDQLLKEYSEPLPGFSVAREAKPRAESVPVISYQVVFDDDDQLVAWYAFLRRLKLAMPEATVGERIAAWAQERGIA